MSKPEADADIAYWDWLRYARLSHPQGEPTSAPRGTPPESLIARLAPLLYHNAHRFGHADQLPEHLATALQQTSIRLVSIQGLYRNWLSGFGRKLQQHGLQTVLLKGSAFNGWIYPDSAPRYSVDVDLYVRPTDFATACDLMSSTHQGMLLDEDRKATHERLFERVFAPLASGLPTVEIHRGLTNPFLYRVDAERLLRLTTPHPTYDSEALRTLTPEHNLLNLALHASRDRDFVTYGLLDAHELWCQANPDPDLLLQEAGAWQAETPLYFLLRNAAKHLDTPIRDDLLSALRPASWRRFLTKKTTRQQAGQPAPPAGRLSQLVANFGLTDRAGNAIAFQWDYLKMRLADIQSR